MNSIIIFGAKYLFIFVVVLAFIYFVQLDRQRKKQYIIFALITLPVTYIVAKVLGHFIYNPRPFISSGVQPLISHAADNGFPSDHTLFVSSLAVITYVFNKRGGIVLGVLAVLVGISRVLAGVHHGADVVGAAVIAIVVAIIIRKFLGKRIQRV
jgi:undecaprenyl-diphosphatase